MTVAWTDALVAVDWEELSELYRLAPLGNKSPAWLEQAFSNSMFRCFALDDGKLVAAGRALADGVDCSYICDIAVLPSHQGSGLGKQVIQRLIDSSKVRAVVVLIGIAYCGPHSYGYSLVRLILARAGYALDLDIGGV